MKRLRLPQTVGLSPAQPNKRPTLVGIQFLSGDSQGPPTMD
jgi:hypothetical protein